MKLKFTACLALILFLILSCKKEDPTYRLAGCVINGRTSYPIADANVSVEKQVVSGGAFGATYSQAASAKTDEFGVYQMEWPRENFAALKLIASKSNYITAEKNLTVSQFEGGNLVNENNTIFPEAFITVKIQNTGETNSQDQINFTFTNAEFDCVCCSNGFKVFQGAEIDTQYTCKLYGDMWLKYQKHIYLAESDTIANDSIWCPAFQTTELLIQY